MLTPDRRFILGMHRRLAGPPTENAVWSPYAVASALELFAAGAHGRAREKWVRLLGKPAALPPFAPANTLWVDRGVPVGTGGSVRVLDLGGDPDQARREIDADVERATHGLIGGIVPAGLLTRDTRAVLTSALCLRTPWTTALNLTIPLPFRTPTGTAELPMMSCLRRLPHRRYDGWKVVTLPADGDVVADVLLPDGDLAGAEAALLPSQLDGLVRNTRRGWVSVRLPYFTVRGGGDLAGPLAELGVPLRVDGRPALDAALHRAVLTVDQDGLGHAPGNPEGPRTTDWTEPPPFFEIRVDRPFLLLIRHLPTNTVLHLARITDPG